MATAPLPGVQLHHELVGAGPPLLAINGSGTDLRMPMSSLEWPVVAHFSVAAYDHRGLGRSRPDDADQQPTMDGIAPLANSEALAGRIPGARLAVFDGGHGFFAQDPAAWPAMVDFLT